MFSEFSTLDFSLSRCGGMNLNNRKKRLYAELEERIRTMVDVELLENQQFV